MSTKHIPSLTEVGWLWSSPWDLWLGAILPLVGVNQRSQPTSVFHISFKLQFPASSKMKFQWRWFDSKSVACGNPCETREIAVFDHDFIDVFSVWPIWSCYKFPMNFRTKSLLLYKNKLIWLTDGQDAALNHQEQSSAIFFRKQKNTMQKMVLDMSSSLLMCYF